MIAKRIVLFCVMLFLCTPSFAIRMTYPDLVKRLYDLDALAIPPVPGEKCAQWSSYDRASRYDPVTGKYIDWDANGDSNGVIRMEGDQAVMAEMKGPGCIFLIWSAAPGNGHVKIYLDGKTEPVVDLPFNGYFNRENEPFTYPSLVNYVSNGANSYIPIPYQKSCKIVADPGWGAYYHFTYVTFPPGTQVPTFTRNLSKVDRDALQQADDILSGALGCDPMSPHIGARTTQGQCVINPGQTKVLHQYDGSGAITGIHINTQFEDRIDQMKGLRDMTISMYWDKEKSPSVWAPLGDFFGTAPGVNYYRSLPLGMTREGYYSYWYMPFGNGAKIEVTNDGKEPRTLTYSISTAPPFANPKDLLRFHCKWHRDAFLPVNPDRQIDWPMLKTIGMGRYVGVMLHIWNPKGGWWGEGDEKFFVDGEKFPSTFGTGSEDFFGYAWSSDQLFQNAFHDQTYNDGGSKGNVSVNRWEIAENVPFQKSFEGDIEKYFPNSRPTLYACTAYWYQKAGEEDRYPELPVSDRTGYPFMQPPVTFKVPGALEGEKLNVLSVSGGTTQTQELNGFEGEWSGDAQLWWTGAKPGDTLSLQIPVTKDGNYRIDAQFTKAHDYGIVQLSMDGQTLGSPIDFYNGSVAPSGQLTLGTMHLTAGNHVLEAKIIGANPNAVKSYMFGLDYVFLSLMQ